MEWGPSETVVPKSTVTGNSKDLRAALLAISKANPKRAGMAIARFLSNDSNAQVRIAAIEAYGAQDYEANAHKMIVAGIKRAMHHHHSGGTRTTAAETFVKNVATACLFEIVKKEANVSKATISRLIRISTHQIGLAYCHVQGLLADGFVATPLQQKRRKDYIRGHLKPFTFNFLCDDKYTRLDTNKRLVSCENIVYSLF